MKAATIDPQFVSGPAPSNPGVGVTPTYVQPNAVPAPQSALVQSQTSTGAANGIAPKSGV